MSKVGKALGWLRRRLHDVAKIGPAIVSVFGIKPKTAVGKGVEKAKELDDALPK